MEQQYGFVATEYCAGVSTPLDLIGYHQTAAGRFAALYRAGSSGQYAIKSFFQANSEEAARDEYLLLAKLNERGCPNVPHAYCYGTFTDSTGAHPAFVMQYIDGKTLTDIISGGGLASGTERQFLDAADAANIALSIARALAGIAEVHVAQRDLSPNNIMIANSSLARPRQKDFELYVVDFSQSTLTTRNTITLGNQRLSTVPFGAPEIFGGAHVGRRNREQCDVWSLGALIVSMVAGEYWPSTIQDLQSKEWLGKDDLERIVRAKRHPLDLVERMEAVGRQPDVFAERLSDIVSVCTNYNPSYRPNLRDVIDDLEELVKPNAVAPVTPRLKQSPTAETVYVPSVRTAELKRDGGVVVVKKGVADYTWIELKRIARAIAVASSDEEGLRIAKEYNLVNESGELRGVTKPLILTNGTETCIRILGFRHDSRASGGKAGIAFEFVDVPMEHVMNKDMTSVGGWEASEMRVWLNASFLTLLPRGLRNLIIPVVKMTNNTGTVEHKDDAWVVTPTLDRLWLLSMTEVYGMLTAQENSRLWASTICDAEGTQYQLYADQGVSTTNSDYCKSVISSCWWLRSPYYDIDGGFYCVGDYVVGSAYEEYGVSPCFCF